MKKQVRSLYETVCKLSNKVNKLRSTDVNSEEDFTEITNVYSNSNFYEGLQIIITDVVNFRYEVYNEVSEEVVRKFEQTFNSINEFEVWFTEHYVNFMNVN